MKLSWAAAYAFHLFCLFAFLTLVMLPLFVGMVFGTPPLRSDHRAHIEMLQDGLAGKGWPAHLLYHLVVYTVSGFKSTFPALGKASVTVLMSCVLAKAWIAFEWMRRSCVVTDAKTTNTLSAFYGVTALTFIMVVTAALMFAAPLMRPHHGDVIYLGQLTPNLYHNPTSLLVWPIALCLFFAGYQFLCDGRWRMLVVVAVLSAVSVLAKPNYFLAFAPAFGLAALYRYRVTCRTALSAVALLPTILILFWQLSTSFGGDTPIGNDRHIAFMPLTAWSVWSANIPLSLVVSLAFPATYAILFGRQIMRPALLAFAWSILAVAVLWLAAFIEIHNDGHIYKDFNFAWGAFIALFPLFLVTLSDLLSNPAANVVVENNGRLSLARNYRALAAWLLFNLHVWTGGVWLFRQIFNVGYA
jgi:hypothetical protein